MKDKIFNGIDSIPQKTREKHNGNNPFPGLSI